MHVPFEANAGQFPSDVSFLVHGRDADLILGDDASFVVHSKRSDGSACVANVDLVLPPHTTPVGEQLLATRTSYFLGNDPARWRSDVPTYASVTYSARSAGGVSVRFHGSDDGRLEYDLAVPAHTDVSTISLKIRGGEARIRKGALVIETPCGELVQEPPATFEGASRRPVRAAYRIEAPDRIGFDVESDLAEDLLIDPTLVFSTLLPGVDSSVAIASDDKGYVYVAGTTSQTTFPVKNAYQQTDAGYSDVWIAKLAADGSSLSYATYLGGSSYDGARSIAVDASQNVYVVGSASSTFPTVNAFQTKPSGSFVAKLDASGSSLVYSSFLGGSTSDMAYAVAVDATGAAYVGGLTQSFDFPVTSGAYQKTLLGQEDGFVAKVAAAGNALVYATYLGGNWYDYVNALAVDASGSVFATGRAQSSDFPTKNAMQPNYGGGLEAFVTKLSPDGSSLAYSTYLGGSYDEDGRSIALDASGDAYVAGYTMSSNFPLKNAWQSSLSGSEDAFVTKLDSSGALVTSTYFGGSSWDYASTIAVVPSGDVFLYGPTSSSDFPTKNAFQSTLGGAQDCYLSRFDASISSLVYSTFIGGYWTDDAYAMSVDSAKSAYLTGTTGSSNFPLRNALFTTGSVFVAKIGSLTISPVTATVPPKGNQTFVASEGSGSGYAFTLSSNSSGGSITSSGVYTAGAKGNVTDVVQLTDSTNTTTTATVTVGPNVTIVPAAPSTPPNGTIAFTAKGGNGSGYVWSLASNNSGGTIATSTGAYKAGATDNVVDTVMVVDPLGNSATALIVIGSGVTIVPTAPSAPPNGAITFSASGGSGTGFVWSIAKNASGATIDSTSGAYEAGATAKTVDTVRVDDSFGNEALVNVSVGEGLAIDPAAPKSPPRGSVQLVAIGGAGSNYAWHLDTNASGGSIDATSGLYVAGAKGNVSDVVSVVDALANAATVAIEVGPGIEISPITAAVNPSASMPFVATGGAGKGYQWSLSSNASGGVIDADSGVYTAGPNEGADHVHVADDLGNEGQALALVGSPDAGGAPAVAGGGCSCTVERERFVDGGAGFVALVAALLGRRRSRRTT